MNRTQILQLVSRLPANLLKGTLNERKPFILSHLITSRCNYSCPHCLWHESRTDDQSLEEIRALYRQARSNGFVANYIWGGEPMVRSDFPEILRASKENGLITLVNTNAWYLEKKLDRIAPWLDMLIVSLNGSSPDIHDPTTGIEGSFRKTVDAVATMRRKHPGIPVIFNSLVFENNRHDIGNILGLWKRMGVRGYFNFIEIDLRKSTGMGNRNEPLDVSEAGRRDIARELRDMKKTHPEILNTDAYFEHFMEGRRSYRCHFPKMFLEIYPDGSVLDCVNADKPLGNVRDTPLRTLLRHPRIQGMIEDGENWCDVHNNADRIDASLMWELRPESVMIGARFLLSHGKDRLIGAWRQA